MCWQTKKESGRENQIEVSANDEKGCVRIKTKESVGVEERGQNKGSKQLIKAEDMNSYRTPLQALI